jgi:seryl-tRNA synthetase
MIDFEHRLTVVEDRSKSNTHRLDEVEKKQNDLSELVGTVKVLATKQKGIEDDVTEIKNDVKTLTSQPAKRWETLVSQIITLVVAAVVGFILAKIGL